MITRESIVQDKAALEGHGEPLTEDSLPEEMPLIEEAAAWVLEPENNALGLAARQLGSKRSWFVMKNPDQGRQMNPSPGIQKVLIVANPKILEFKGQSVWRVESCFSMPGESWRIRRNSDILVRFQLVENGSLGKKQRSIFSGLSAQVFQHESSHCRGTLISHVGEPVTLKSIEK